MRQLRLWNGRWLGNRHVYVAAYSVKDAIQVTTQAREKLNDGWWQVTEHEITKYWSCAWGNQMQNVKPERGVWIAKNWFDEPERVI